MLLRLCADCGRGHGEEARSCAECGRPLGDGVELEGAVPDAPEAPAPGEPTAPHGDEADGVDGPDEAASSRPRLLFVLLVAVPALLLIASTAWAVYVGTTTDASPRLLIEAGPTTMLGHGRTTEDFALAATSELRVRMVVHGAPVVACFLDAKDAAAFERGDPVGACDGPPGNVTRTLPAGDYALGLWCTERDRPCRVELEVWATPRV